MMKMLPDIVPACGATDPPTVTDPTEHGAVHVAVVVSESPV